MSSYLLEFLVIHIAISLKKSSSLYSIDKSFGVPDIKGQLLKDSLDGV